MAARGAAKARMKKFLFLLGLLALSGATSHAEVLIYKGKGTTVTIPGFIIPPKFDAYFIADILNKQIGLVVFFKGNGGKSQIQGAPFPLDTTTAPVEGGGNARILVTGSTPQPAPNFTYSSTFFRGIQKPILVSTGTVDITRNEPRVFKGGVTNASENSGKGDFVDLRLSVFYQQLRTVKANNDTRTLEQTLDDLSAELTDKGYAVITP